MDDSPINDPAAPEPKAREQMRGDMRESMFLMGTIARGDGAQVPIKVRNLSAGGMMAECPTGFLNGEPVVAHLRSIDPIAGKIAWVLGSRIGVAFDAPIDPKRARTPITTAPPRPMVQAARSSWRPGLR